MPIKINHITKKEGSAGPMASILSGDVKDAKSQIQKGTHLTEGVLIGRHYKEMPVIAQRICGVCSVAHNIASIKSVENAMKVKISEETKKLRKVMEHAQFIYSHALHLFFLSLIDSLDIENDLQLTKEYSKETKKIIEIREYGMELIKVIGGRVIHPLTNEIGGFKKVPTADEIKSLILKGEEIMPMTLELGKFFKTIKTPNFSRPTEYICLKKSGEYAIYEGDVVSNKGLNVDINDIENNFHKFQRPKEIIKRTERDGKTSYMIGAIARINNNHDKLSYNAQKYLQSLNFNMPDYNTFHNVLYQMVEIIHCAEESVKLLKELAHADLTNAITKEYGIVEGSAAAAIESPQGTLYYWVDIDAKGYIKNVNIITPTAQFLTHLEDDIVAFTSSRIVDSNVKAKEKKIRALIRAYDPCVSCALH